MKKLLKANKINQGKILTSVARLALTMIIYALLMNSSSARGATNDNYTFKSAMSTSFKDGKMQENFITVPGFSNKTSAVPLVVKLDPKIKFQKMMGYGAALTEACAINLDRMDSDKRHQLMMDIFKPETGGGLNFIRIPLGGNDFSISDFSLDDSPNNQPDPELKYYSFAREQKLISALLEAKKINPEMAFMLTPWSAPAWMKDTKKLPGGVLEEKNYDVYAKYLIRSLNEFANRGIQIDYLSVLNEPLIGDSAKNWYFMQMYMPTDQMTVFIKQHLAPMLQTEYKAGRLKTKVLLHDHNWANADYVDKMLDDAQVKAVVGGVAFHCYGGNVASMRTSLTRHPDVPAFNTECTGGFGAEPNSFNFQWWLKQQTLDATHEGSTGALAWNLCLDNNGLPHNAGGCHNCRGAVSISEEGKATFNQEFRALAQMSRYVRRGATRIASSDISSHGISNSAFENPDGSTVLVLRNELDAAATVSVQNENNESTTVEIPAKGAISVFWQASPKKS